MTQEQEQQLLHKITDILAEKHTTPLFIREAFMLYEKGQYRRALECADAGLEQYPGHHPAMIVKAMILAASGKKKDALLFIRKVSAMLGLPQIIRHYTELLELQDADATPSDDSMYLNLNTIAEKISDGLPEAGTDEAGGGQKPGRDQSTEFVQETMARIYERQGVFREALRLYELLAEHNTPKKEEYRLRIEEIRKRIT